ncbi:hypothetical protein GCM10023075_64930 [Streptosporangium album]
MVELRRQSLPPCQTAVPALVAPIAGTGLAALLTAAAAFLTVLIVLATGEEDLRAARCRRTGVVAPVQIHRLQPGSDAVFG